MTDHTNGAPERIPELSLLDYFAAHSLAAVCEVVRPGKAAKVAYEIAAAMIRERQAISQQIHEPCIPGMFEPDSEPCVVCCGSGALDDGNECPDCKGIGFVLTQEARQRAEAASYALNKQLSTAHTLESNYGGLELDDELRQAIIMALTPILERRAAMLEGTE